MVTDLFFKTDLERLYIGNLSFDTTGDDLKKVFEEVGEVVTLFISADRASGKSRGYGFAQMPPDAALKALETLDGAEVDGRNIRVSRAETKVPKTRIYCGNLSFDSTLEDIKSMFAEFGEVYDIFLPTDKVTGNSRGFAIVTMEKTVAINAIEGLADVELDGRYLTVNEARPKGAAPAGERTKIYVGNLSFDTTVDTVQQTFEEYGEVFNCFIPQDMSFGGSRGFGFVVMNEADAGPAIEELDGIELDGRQIRVNEAENQRKPNFRRDEGGDFGGGDSYDDAPYPDDGYDDGY